MSIEEEQTSSVRDVGEVSSDECSQLEPNQADVDSAEEDGEGEELDQIQVNCLKPTSLMVLKVSIGDGRKVSALVDSGASRSLIKNCYMGHDQLTPTTDAMRVMGLGDNKLEVLGMARVSIGFMDREFLGEFLVVADQAIQHDIILGVDFLKANRVKLDMSRSKLTLRMKDGSCAIVSVNDGGEIAGVMWEKVPVYCTQQVKVKHGKVESVPINFQCNYGFSEDSLLYFESSECDVLGGVCKPDQNFAIADDSKMDWDIKKGQVIGHVYTVLVTDNNEEDEPDSEDWNATKIEEVVKLGENLSEDQKADVRRMLLNSSQALSKGDDDIGCANVEPHRIEVTNETPIWQRPRNFSQPVNDEIERQCAELLANNILEYSDSNWSSPVVPVRKSDNSLRLCIDYRQVNKVTKTENYPMPNLTKCIYRSHNTKFFSKIDLVRGYYQVKISEDSRKYTAFSTLQHHYQFRRLSFGLKNSGMAFQKMMQQILAPMLSHKIVIYIDDILIMSESFQEHLELVSKVLNLLQLHGIKIKVKKCELFREEVSFLGHIISGEGIKKSPDYVEKVLQVDKPRTVKDMRKFLGLINFQRKFIERCSELTACLTEWTVGAGSRKVEWSEEMEGAFCKLKELVAKDVMLTYPDYSDSAEKMELYVDASGSACGACLMQKRDGEYRVIAYASMTFSDTERRYSATDRELAALRWGINNFRCFLAGVAFLVFSDHKPLIFLEHMSSSNSRLMRTVAELAEFDYEVRYRPGVDNEAADFLSRMDGSVQASEEEVSNPRFLPKELKVIAEVPGGGDSMFESLHIAMKEAKESDGYSGVFPSNHEELRQELADELIKNGKQYGLGKGKQLRQKLKLMRKCGQQPISEVLLAASKLYGIRILVYHGMRYPIVFTYKGDESDFVIRLQCISMIHYNPVYERKTANDRIKGKYVNMACFEAEQPDTDAEDGSAGLDMEVNLAEVSDDSLPCGHIIYHSEVKVMGVSKPYCCLLDCGSQVCLVQRKVVEEIQEAGGEVSLEDAVIRLVGIGRDGENSINYAVMALEFHGRPSEPLPFAIMKDQAIPCCFLLGANFIRQNDIVMDFEVSSISLNGETPETYIVNSAWTQQDCVYKFGPVYVKRVSNTACGATLNYDTEPESDDDDRLIIPKFVVPEQQLLQMQRRDHALRNLKAMIVKGTPTKEWKVPALKQFKWSASRIHVRNGLLKYEHNGVSSVVASFPFMVEVVSQSHHSTNHSGRHRLMGAIQPHFWHPGLDKLCLEFCRSCAYCQLYKVRRIDKPPPILKVQSQYPFNLVCIDTLSLPKTRRGNVALVVCVDHFSKWLAAVPVKDKKASTIAFMFKSQMLPGMPKVPDRLISDNGPEYRGSEFESMLKDYSIEHCYSTPGHPAGNGACEKVNQTLTQMLRSEGLEWDLNVSKVVINYNNSVHSTTRVSPSQNILTRQHQVIPTLPLAKEVTQSWREGNPNFCAFKKGQKVVRKIPVCGNLLRDKLSMKFEGPFVVEKVQSNGVSYVISELVNPDRRLKVNHRQVRPWYDIPKHILRHVRSNPATLKDGLTERPIRKRKVKGGESSCDSSTSSSDSESSDDGASGSAGKVSVGRAPRASSPASIGLPMDNMDAATQTERRRDTFRNDQTSRISTVSTKVAWTQTDVEITGGVRERRIAERHQHQAFCENIGFLKACQQAISLCEEIVDDAVESSRSSSMIGESWESGGLNQAYNTSPVTGYSTQLAIDADGALQSTRLSGESIEGSEELSVMGAHSSCSFGGFSPVQGTAAGESGDNPIMDAFTRIKRVCANIRNIGSSLHESTSYRSLAAEGTTDGQGDRDITECYDVLSELPTNSPLYRLRSRNVAAAPVKRRPYNRRTVDS